VQILSGLAWLYIAAFVSDVTNDVSSGTSLKSLERRRSRGGRRAGVHRARRPRLRRPVHHAGRQVQPGRQGIRITTWVYGALGSVVGLIGLFVGLDTGTATAVILPLLWVVFAGIITAARWFPAARRGSHASGTEQYNCTNSAAIWP